MNKLSSSLQASRKAQCLACHPLRPSLHSRRRQYTIPTHYNPPTIFAPATGRSKSAISVLRCSGPEAIQVWHRMTAPPRMMKGKGTGKEVLPTPRKAILRSIVHPESGEVLDEGVVLYFPKESALTAQPTIELQCHGSPALISLLLDVLPTLSPSFRIAEPGEFTRLAFEAGKMDLTEVEGLHDLIEADTESQRKLAARQAGGQMRKVYDSLRTNIIEAMSLIEALIDFGEDEGISEGVFEQARTKALSLQSTLIRRLSDSRLGETLRSGIQLTILGPPNAGKSSLLNLLAQRDAAIVTATPGTTRDVVEVSLDFGGFKVLCADTAGLRIGEEVGEVERIGVERAYRKANEADVKIVLFSLPELFSESSNIATIDPMTLSLIDGNSLIVLNKTDSFDLTATHRKAIRTALAGKAWMGQFLEVSIKEENGTRELLNTLGRVLEERFALSDDLEDSPLITQARHRRHLEECLSAIEDFLQKDSEDIVMAAEDLRYAAMSIGRITGAVDVEEVLGEIFRGFCVGK